MGFIDNELRVDRHPILVVFDEVVLQDAEIDAVLLQSRPVDFGDGDFEHHLLIDEIGHDQGVRFGALEPRDCIIHDEGAYSPSNCQVLRRPASKCFAFWIVARSFCNTVWTSGENDEMYSSVFFGFDLRVAMDLHLRFCRPTLAANLRGLHAAEYQNA